MARLDALRDLPAFEALDGDARLALATALAGALGADYRPVATTVGAAAMVGVIHAPSGVELVAVPGGTFEMGFTEHDDEALRACVDAAAVPVIVALQAIETAAAPVHTVRVAPFLLSRMHLTSAQVAALSGGAVRFDIVEAADAAAFARASGPLRLPSEAELEYVGREGGAVSLLHDGGSAWAQHRTWPEANAWGFRALTFPAWAGDEWHDDYDGAPTTSAAWSSGGAPGVFRGGLVRPPASDAEVAFALAAYRGRWNPDDAWDVGVRVARSLDV